MTDHLRWDPELTTDPGTRSLFRDPIRAGLVAGAIVMAVGAFMPWAEGHVGLLPKQFGGLDGAADGLIMSGFAIVLLVIARSPDFLESADGARRWAPMLIGLACLALWLLGRQQAEMAIHSWQEDSGGGTLSVGWWVAGVGTLIVAVVGSIASLRRRPGETKVSIRAIGVARPRRSSIGPLAAAIGAMVGTVAGAAFALAVFPPITVGAPMVFFGGLGLVFGGFAGSSIGRRLVRLLS
jgi:hypothetical protein